MCEAVCTAWVGVAVLVGLCAAVFRLCRRVHDYDEWHYSQLVAGPPVTEVCDVDNFSSNGVEFRAGVCVRPPCLRCGRPGAGLTKLRASLCVACADEFDVPLMLFDVIDAIVTDMTRGEDKAGEDKAGDAGGEPVPA